MVQLGVSWRWRRRRRGGWALLTRWGLTNFGPTRSVRVELALLIDDHDRVGAGRHVWVNSFLHARGSLQLYVPSRGKVSRFVGATNRARRGSAVGIRPVPHHGHVAFGDRLLESLLLAFADVNRQLLRLQIEARISHFHAAAENAHVFVRIKKRFVGVDLGRGRLVRGGFVVRLEWIRAR